VKDAHFIGHSFGSVVMAWVTKQSPELIRRATYLDPVVFLLCKSDVAYNFVYRVPQTATENLMQYFVARELYIAHSLGRNFVWHECILWPEDLTTYPEGALVFLSGQDSIVPAHSVRRYLECVKAPTTPGSPSSPSSQRVPAGGRLDVLFYEDLGHAQFLLSAETMDDVITRAFAHHDGPG